MVYCLTVSGHLNYTYEETVSYTHLGADGGLCARQTGDGGNHAGNAGGKHLGGGDDLSGGVLGPDEGHSTQGDQGQRTLDEHAAVGDGLGVPLVVQLLGGGAGAHQGVEAGDGAAGDGDEQSGEDIARCV